MGNNKNKLPDIPQKEQLVKFFETIFLPKLSIACFVGVTCGLRVSEVCKIEISDIDFQRQQIKIKDGKNPNRAKQGDYGKDRYVPFPDIAISPIKRWIEIIDGGKWFIPSENSPDKHLRTKTLHEWFKDARKRAGLDEVICIIPRKNQNSMRQYKFRFHNLRHWYGTNHFEKNRDIYTLSTILGHKRLETTAVYAKVSNVIKKETVDKAFSRSIITPVKINNEPIKSDNQIIIKTSEKEKSPIELLQERLAKGEISDLDFQNKIRLINLSKGFIEKEENEYDKSEIKNNRL